MIASMSDSLAFVLASASPRRRSLLARCGAGFTVAPVETARRLAVAKAKAALAARSADDPLAVVGADTVVAVDGRILGKPADASEAVAMLRALSGRTHLVVSAWSVACVGGAVRTGHSTAAVEFESLELPDIEAYVATGEPLDKAGAYGIQGGASRFVRTLKGEFDVVVGLPVAAVLEALAACGVLPSAADPVARRLAAVRGRIEAAAQAAGRCAEDVTLVAVSKQQPLAAIRAAVAAGQRVFGESYVQEWRDKTSALPDWIEWHFIGGLQRNKVRFLVDEIALLHSLGSSRTAATLARRASERGREVGVLLQVALAVEKSKGGVAPEALPDLLDAVGAMAGLRVEGLMAIPPAVGPGAARRYFARLRALRDAVATPDRPLCSLSMGMSSDFDVAIAEGATHVRVGTAIFGPRG